MKILVFTCSILILSFSTLFANTWYVKPDGTGDAPTIQAAIDSSSNGDTIELANGTYTGVGNRDITFMGRAITVTSESNDPTTCIIDCQGSNSNRHRGFIFHTLEDSNSILSSVTITNGYYSSGSGISCYDASPSITNCIIKNNHSFGKSPSFTMGGGGMSCESNTHPILTNCIFINNHADSQGGGLYARDADATIEGCIFINNSAYGSSESAGGGIYCDYGSDLQVSNSIFIDNGSMKGGAAYGDQTSSYIFTNCIIFSNISEDSQGPIGCRASTLATLTCCDVFANEGGDWEGCIAGQYGINGNFSADPQFCSANSFYLQTDSPCAPGNHPDEEPCGLIGAYPVGCGDQQCCDIQPLDLNFGSVAVCDSADLDFTIYNSTGCDTLDVNISESCDHYEIVSGGGGYSLAPGDSHVVTVRFRSTLPGTWNCTIQAGSVCGYVSCLGNSFSDPCEVQPKTLDFGSITMCDSADLDFTVYNNSGCEALNGSITESCDHFEIAAGGGDYSLAPGDSHVVTVRFKSTLPGTWNCTIQTGTECANIGCQGTTQPSCTVLPMILSFGSITVGDSADLDFKIYNTGCDTLKGSATESCNHYEIVSGGGGYSLAPGDSHVVTVRFKPTVPGTWNCTIQTGAECTNVGCNGSSTEPPPTCLIEPDTLDFGNVAVGGFKMMTFDITNTGYGTLEGTVSDECTNFGIVSGGTYSLAHDQSQTVTIVYLPQTPGPYNCTIETGNDACTDLYCLGYGAGPAECTVNPDTLDFGIVIATDSLDMNFDIINAGGGILSGAVSDTCSYYEVVAGGGSYGLAAGETLHVTVRFKPQAGGTFVCWVETGASCSNVYCSGEGNDVTGLGIVNPNRFCLYQNYPNPFNPSTNITFTVPNRSHTNLSIYNIEGKLVRTLIDTDFDGGVKTVCWNGTDSKGNPVSTGVYFYRLRAGSDVMTKKMVLLK